jgi:DNA repair exonuclease SbcCD ATPase subunit
MIYEELQQRYGAHVAKRIQRELNQSEFSSVHLENLKNHLEQRVERTEKNYKSLMSNPLENGNVRSEILQKQWHEAENLAYLLSIAEDVSSTVRAAIASGQ